MTSSDIAGAHPLPVLPRDDVTRVNHVTTDDSDHVYMPSSAVPVSSISESGVQRSQSGSRKVIGSSSARPDLERYPPATVISDSSGSSEENGSVGEAYGLNSEPFRDQSWGQQGRDAGGSAPEPSRGTAGIIEPSRKTPGVTEPFQGHTLGRQTLEETPGGLSAIHPDTRDGPSAIRSDTRGPAIRLSASCQISSTPKDNLGLDGPQFSMSYSSVRPPDTEPRTTGNSVERSEKITIVKHQKLKSAGVLLPYQYVVFIFLYRVDQKFSSFYVYFIFIFI